MFRPLLALWFLVGVSTTTEDTFSTSFPAGLPDVAGWERVTGDVQNDRMSLSYLLYVNPVRPGLYEIIRYRLRFLAPTSEQQKTYAPVEKLVWNERARSPLRSFERDGRGPSAWRELPYRSRGYLAEMGVVLQLMSLHNSLLWKREAARAADGARP